MNNEALIPMLGVITAIREDTHDIKTFRVEGVDRDLFTFIPGQCAMVSMPGVGEGMFSITSSPTETGYLDFSIKECGCLTEWLHRMDVGQQITVRGPYGNGFPVDTEFKGKDLLFVAGGIGLAPLHSVINYVRAKRGDYGKITVVYGAKSAADRMNKEELALWAKEDGLTLCETIDKAEEGWNAHVGFVPAYVTELSPATTQTAIVCGPPIMIKFTMQALKELGFADENIYTTMEMRMKCGVGKCGRCNIGSKYVCKDGPVFRWDQLEQLPDEY